VCGTIVFLNNRPIESLFILSFVLKAQLAGHIRLKGIPGELAYEDFTSSRFVRRRRIRELMAAGVVDEMLRRPVAAGGS
jgi:hypothetical protein